MPGPVTSEAEVTNISKHGFWLLVAAASCSSPSTSSRGSSELRSTRSCTLERPTAGHLHWPELDIDLSLDSIEHPERYPLKSRL